jgi:predicted phage terminase large subunit-like protein
MALLENLMELLAIKRARWNLHAFIRYTKPKYESTWFNEIVCDALQRVEARIVARDDARLLIRMPPRSGKSEIVSRKFPAWFMGRHPEMDIINSSYNAKLAKNLGGHARNLMGTELYQRVFPGVRLSKDSKSKDKWNTEAGGSFTAAGVEGGLTGEGAHALILDDFYKNSKEAWSALVRENVEDWYKSVAYTRLAPGGAVIILCTQWHEAGLDNAVQRWAKEDPEGPQWEVIDIPAIMEESYRNKHPMDSRKDGESYWPDRWPVKKLKSIMKVVGSYIWSALYQQRASSEAGAIVLREWIQYWSKLPARFDDMVISCDLAFKGKEDSDNVAMQVWGRVKVKITYEDKSFDYDYHYYLIDRISRPMEFVATLQAFDLLARRYPKAKQLVEDKANGPALQSVLKKKYPRIIMVPVDTDKAGRFRAVAPIFERRCVFLPDPKVHAWSETVTDEYVKFPNVDHDDDVDATSQGLGHWEVPADGVPGFVAAVM